jgi:hypothetical protein
MGEDARMEYDEMAECLPWWRHTSSRSTAPEGVRASLRPTSQHHNSSENIRKNSPDRCATRAACGAVSLGPLLEKLGSLCRIRCLHASLAV